MTLREQVESKLADLIKDHDVKGHSMDHFIAVRDHALKALKCERLPSRTKLQIELAALLHDADDRKIFPFSVNNKNARAILQTLHVDGKDKFIDDIIQMIDLVSCSKNGDSEPPQRWMAIPRDCDRLEAIGIIGIERCNEYSKMINLPYHLADTPVVRTEAELWKIATPERFAKYKEIKMSVSTIDHYYDKLLHIGKPECLRSQNKYILEEAARRNNVMVEFVLNYWN